MADAHELVPGRLNGILLDFRRGPAGMPSWWFARVNHGVEPATRDLEAFFVGDTQIRTLLRDDELTTAAGGGPMEYIVGFDLDRGWADPAAPDDVRLYPLWVGGCSAGTCLHLHRVTLRLTDVTAPQVVHNELLLRIAVPSYSHLGGGVRVAPNGELLVTIGDLTFSGDPPCNAQNLFTPAGKLLRLDVRTPATGYAIPASNPYRLTSSGEDNPQCNDFLAVVDPFATAPLLTRATPCPEIVAVGFRNPFRMSIDPVTGMAWISDVGNDAAEEVNRLPSNTGGLVNFGWPLQEATAPGPPGHACSALPDDAIEVTQLVHPFAYWLHAEGGGRGFSAGAVVYRGSAMPNYAGKLFFADGQSGEVWIVDPEGPPPGNVGSSALANLSLPGFGLFDSPEGELLGARALETGGFAMELTLEPPSGTFPTTLRETGCFDSVDPWLPSQGFVPYDVAAPLASDGTLKTRYLRLPEGEKAGLIGEGWLDLPVGTVLVKTFASPSGRRLETRLSFRHADGSWGLYPYVWNAAQTEATLHHQSAYIAEANWFTPSRSECTRCHRRDLNAPIGLEVAQLNRDVNVGGRVLNQLLYLGELELWDGPPPDPLTVPRLVNPEDTGHSLEERARSYLHGNCAHCHSYYGQLVAFPLDLRGTIPFAASGLCNGFGVTAGPNERLVVPQDPSLSLVHRRMIDPVRRMPPLGTTIVDTEAADLVAGWIDALAPCP